MWAAAILSSGRKTRGPSASQRFFCVPACRAGFRKISRANSGPNWRGTGGPHAGEPCAVRIGEAGGRALLTRAARSSAAESFWLTITALPLPSFSKVFILKAVEILCFDTLLEVLILKVVTRHIHPPLRVLILNDLEIEKG